ncbi:hypothetical protein D3C72_1749610 [compost metagenome]
MADFSEETESSSVRLRRFCSAISCKASRSEVSRRRMVSLSSPPGTEILLWSETPCAMAGAREVAGVARAISRAMLLVHFLTRVPHGLKLEVMPSLGW